MHLCRGCAILFLTPTNQEEGEMRKQATPQKPRKKMTQAQARKKWLQSKQGQKWLAEKIRIESDLEIAHELRKFCV